MEAARGIRVTVLGPPTVGKTTLIKTFLEGQYVAKPTSKHGDVYVKPWVVNNRLVPAKILDAGTETEFRIDSYIQFGEVFMVVFAVDDKDSFDEGVKYTKILLEKRPGVPVILVGNKADIETRAVTCDVATSIAAELGVPYSEVARTGENVKETFDCALRAVTPNHTATEIASNGDVDRLTQLFGKLQQHCLNDAGSVDVAEYLITQGANPCPEDNAPVLNAAERGRVEMLEYFLEKGGDASKGNPKPIARAALSGNVEAVKLLLSKGADKNGEDQTYSSLNAPIHMATKEGHATMVQFLLDSGVDVNVRDTFGQTPLHIAANHDKSALVTLLLSAGADKTIKDDEDNTAADIADENIAKLLA